MARGRVEFTLDDADTRRLPPLDGPPLAAPDAGSGAEHVTAEPSESDGRGVLIAALFLIGVVVMLLYPPVGLLLLVLTAIVGFLA